MKKKVKYLTKEEKQKICDKNNLCLFCPLSNKGNMCSDDSIKKIENKEVEI